MKAFEHLIGEGEQAVLAGLIGKRVSALYTRSLEVEGRVIRARDYSLSVWLPERHEGYCVLASDWSDTPEEAIDYHVLEVPSASWPKGIERVVEEGRADAMDSPSAIELVDWHASAITRILLLEAREDGEAERVHHDGGLVFERADGYRFALSPPDSIVGGLQFTDEPGLIDELLAAHAVRREFT